MSQLLGNFYLHELDHFIKQTLKIQHYGRYMDDMIFLHPDRDVLFSLIPIIQLFLQNRLGLTLHPDKIVLKKVSEGFLFLGAYIKPWRTYIGNRTKRNMYACIQNGSTVDLITFQQQMQSYFGLLGHFQTQRLRESIEAGFCSENEEHNGESCEYL